MTTTSDTPFDDEQLADEAAPLDALLVDAALSPLRRLAPDASTAKLAVGLARRPRTTARRLGSLAAELARIGAGTSVLAAPKRDRRFVRRPRLDQEPSAAPDRAGLPGGRADGRPARG